MALFPGRTTHLLGRASRFNIKGERADMELAKSQETKMNILDKLRTHSLPIMAGMAIAMGFLVVWKSAGEPPKRDVVEEKEHEEEAPKPKKKQAPKQEVYEEAKSVEHTVLMNYKKRRCLITETPACHKIDCYDGKVLCTNNYTIINE